MSSSRRPTERGGTNNDQDRATGWTYDGLGNVRTLTAYNLTGSTDDQTTQYAYGDNFHADLVTRTIYPDGDSTNDNVQRTYNLDGTPATLTDQRGVVHAYAYNARRQLARDGATTLPGGVDGAVKSLVYDYDSLGRVWGFYSRANADGTGTVHNSVRLTYEAQGYLQYLWQSHEGAGAGSEPKTWHQYDSSHTSNILHNAGRLAILNYPNGATVQFRHGYNTGGMFQNPDNIADRLDQTTMLKFTPSGGSLTDLVAYQYNGVDRPVETDYVGPDVRKQSFNLGGAGANDYNAFDRFGRTVSHRWYDYTGGSALRDQFDYAYDHAGDRLSRNIPSGLYATDDRDQVYTYDGLLRLATFDEGTQSGGSISGTPAREEDWTLDALGNWTAFVQKAAGSTTLNQARSHNDVNEIDTDNTHGDVDASITGTPDWYDPAYDEAGNLLVMPNPKAPTTASIVLYDAWNRPVTYYAINVSGANPVAKYEYDGLHRRIVKIVDANGDGTANETRHYYYNPQWQVVEERLEVSSTIDADPVNQYVWQPHYVDALALRRYDADTDGNFAENQDGEYYYLQDANYNVTAIVNSTGAVVERYAYTPYGVPTILNGASDADGAVTEWAVDSSQAASDNGNAYLFTGREYDWESGIQSNRWRYYASHLGRWLTRDPIYYRAGLNLYAYVDGGALRFVDPLGLAPPERWPAENPFPDNTDHHATFNRGCVGIACLRVGVTSWPWKPDGTQCYSDLEDAKQQLAELQKDSGKPCLIAFQLPKETPLPPCARNADGCIDPKCLDSIDHGGNINVCTYHEPPDDDPYWEWADGGINHPGGMHIFHTPKPPVDYPNIVYCVIPDCACPSKRNNPEGPWGAPHGGWGPYLSDNPSYDPWLWQGVPGWKPPPSLDR